MNKENGNSNNSESKYPINKIKSNSNLKTIKSDNQIRNLFKNDFISNGLISTPNKGISINKIYRQNTQGTVRTISKSKDNVNNSAYSKSKLNTNNSKKRLESPLLSLKQKQPSYLKIKSVGKLKIRIKLNNS